MSNLQPKRSRRKRTSTMDKLVKILATSEKYKFENAAKAIEDALKNRSEQMDDLFSRVASSDAFTVKNTVKALAPETSDHIGDSNNGN